MQIAIRRIGGRQKRRDWTRIARAVRYQMNTVERRKLIAEFDSVVANWNHKPKFIATMGDKGGDFTLSVRPAGKEAQKWRWVSRGTKGPYPIRAKRAKTLAFQKNYQPRTKPGYVFGGPGKSSGPWQFPKEVTHPGIEARLFEEHISKRFAPMFRERIENVIRKEIRKGQ